MRGAGDDGSVKSEEKSPEGCDNSALQEVEIKFHITFLRTADSPNRHIRNVIGAYIIHVPQGFGTIDALRRYCKEVS